PERPPGPARGSSLSRRSRGECRSRAVAGHSHHPLQPSGAGTMRDPTTVPTPRADTHAAGLPRARFAVSVIFLVHGILVSSWMARIPAVKEHLGLPLGTLGIVLLSSAAGALLAMPLTSKLVSRFGSARLTLATTALLCVAIALP